MSKIAFNVDANTARIIGRENVSKLDGAVIELVKNTYDADASICIIYYEKSTQTIYLADNGHGMTEDIVRNQWMTIGYSQKLQNAKSKKGRVQTGSKGIGRFALDRIANTCTMLTKTENSSDILWQVNWEDFEYGKNITDISAELEEVHCDFSEFLSSIKNIHLLEFIVQNHFNHGTIFKLTNLRDEWSPAIVEGLRENLSTLIPPGFDNIFSIYLFTEDTQIEDAKIQTLSNDAYDYKIEFEVKNGWDVTIKIYRNEFDLTRLDEVFFEIGFNEPEKEYEYFHGKPIVYEKTLDQLFPSAMRSDSYSMGSFHGTFYFIKGSVPKKEQYFYKEGLNHKRPDKNFSGIRLYRDDFRVRPYGDPGTPNYDWLQLSTLKSQSPAAVTHKSGSWRVAADQIFGSAHISRLINVTLPDQSNREGIVETVDYIAFKAVLNEIIHEFERERQRVFKVFREYDDKINQNSAIENKIRTHADKEAQLLRKKGSVPESIRRDLYISPIDAQKVIDKQDREIRELEDEKRFLRVLATVGIAANTYVHETRASTHDIRIHLKEAKEALEYDNDVPRALEQINIARTNSTLLNSWFTVTLGSISQDKRERRHCNISDLVTAYIANWNEVTREREIEYKYASRDILFKCYPYEIESILTNLITNSIASFERFRTENPEISIEIDITQDHDGISISYTDNGRGLSRKYKDEPDKILAAFETDKETNKGEKRGTGMGMWIIKSIVDDYKGRLDLSKNKTSESGFHARIYLKGSVKEEKGE
ncbi:sensor histidine kinase [Methanorbis rubei]|uniref:histidine kinase n=1 Tax=Methanorbis rubei TaxID=3028300 RepID=A0AAE4MGA3_9EURY|nr:hypothetical protein [Methanocorpusculaceae archaeon Cs1]